MKVQPIGEVEVKLAVEDGIERCNPDFLLHLSDGGGQRGFAGIDLAAGTVDLARADAAFLADEQQLAVPHDVAERRQLFGHGWRQIPCFQDGRKMKYSTKRTERM